MIQTRSLPQACCGVATCLNMAMRMNATSADQTPGAARC